MSYKFLHDVKCHTCSDTKFHTIFAVKESVILMKIGELRYNSYLILVISLIISNLNGLTFCVIHFCVIHPDFQQSCTQVLCHTQSHVLCHTLFWSEFFCHTPPKQPDFLSYFMMLLLAWSMGAGTALVVHAKNSRPRQASNPHQTP